MENKNLIIYKKRTSVIADEAQGLVIKDEAGLKTAVDYLSEIKSISKKIAEEKAKFTEPANAILKRAREIFAPAEKSYNLAEGLIKGKILGYNLLQEKRAEAKIEKIAEKVETGKMDIVKAAEQAESLTPANSVDGEKGKISYRTIKKIIIQDASKLPHKYLLPNNSLIRIDILKGVKIPGAKVKEEKIVAGY